MNANCNCGRGVLAAGAAAVFGALLSGCVSVDDFRKMGPAERSHFVCQRYSEVRQLDAEIDALSADIVEIEEALHRGYRIHTSCKQEPVTASTTSKKKVKSKCTPDGRGGMVCEEEEIVTDDPKTEYRTVCEETPVAIDSEFEEEKLRRYDWELDDLAAIRDEVYGACILEVNRMSAEEAYDFYQRD